MTPDYTINDICRSIAMYGAAWFRDGNMLETMDEIQAVHAPEVMACVHRIDADNLLGYAHSLRDVTCARGL